jgi:hypothetical protein
MACQAGRPGRTVDAPRSLRVRVKSSGARATPSGARSGCADWPVGGRERGGGRAARGRRRRGDAPTLPMDCAPPQTFVPGRPCRLHRRVAVLEDACWRASRSCVAAVGGCIYSGHVPPRPTARTSCAAEAPGGCPVHDCVCWGAREGGGCGLLGRAALGSCWLRSGPEMSELIGSHMPAVSCRRSPEACADRRALQCLEGMGAI